jgi:sugar O-acyltransferase (sialic acid O-acetyltransferase NeuD family)
MEHSRSAFGSPAQAPHDASDPAVRPATASKRILIVGAGGFGRAVAEAVMAGGQWEVAGFIDDRWPDAPPFGDIAVLGRHTDLVSLTARADGAVVAVGDNRRRSELAQQVLATGLDLVSIVHPRAVVSPSATLGRGVIVMAAAVVGTLARLDDGALVNAGAVVDHDAHVERYAHVGIGATLGGGAVLGAGAWLQQGGVLRTGQRVAAGTVVDRG